MVSTMKLEKSMRKYLDLSKTVIFMGNKHIMDGLEKNASELDRHFKMTDSKAKQA